VFIRVLIFLGVNTSQGSLKYLRSCFLASESKVGILKQSEGVAIKVGGKQKRAGKKAR
jgi:hypothetical protein